MSGSLHIPAQLTVEDECILDLRYRLSRSSSPVLDTYGTGVDRTDEKSLESPQPTPLPRLQVSILLLMLLSEPFTAGVLFPFINNLVYETGVTHGNKAKIGYYAGLIVSFNTQ